VTVATPRDLRFRRPATDDLDAAVAVLAAEELGVRGVASQGTDEIIDWWRRFDLEHGSWLVEADDGRPVAFAASMNRENALEYWVSVVPEFQGLGIATELLRRGEARARELEVRRVYAGMLVENDAARLVLEANGYREVRRFYRMQIDLDGEPESPRWPDGIAVSTFRIEDARPFKDAIDEAFEDDWGFIRSTYEEWKRNRLEAPETDTSLWFIAGDGVEIAGVIRCDGKRFGGGWVGALGVRKPWRGRGIGRALLRHAFVEFHRRGEPHVGLGVDAQNESGALRLYETAGMRVVSADVVFEKELA